MPNLCICRHRFRNILLVEFFKPSFLLPKDPHGVSIAFVSYMRSPTFTVVLWRENVYNPCFCAIKEMLNWPWDVGEIWNLLLAQTIQVHGSCVWPDRFKKDFPLAPYPLQSYVKRMKSTRTACCVSVSFFCVCVCLFVCFFEGVGAWVVNLSWVVNLVLCLFLFYMFSFYKKAPMPVFRGQLLPDRKSLNLLTSDMYGYGILMRVWVHPVRLIPALWRII